MAVNTVLNVLRCDIILLVPSHMRVIGHKVSVPFMENS